MRSLRADITTLRRRLRTQAECLERQKLEMKALTQAAEQVGGTHGGDEDQLNSTVGIQATETSIPTISRVEVALVGAVYYDTKVGMGGEPWSVVIYLLFPAF